MPGSVAHSPPLAVAFDRDDYFAGMSPYVEFGLFAVGNKTNWRFDCKTVDLAIAFLAMHHCARDGSGGVSEHAAH